MIQSTSWVAMKQKNNTHQDFLRALTMGSYSGRFSSCCKIYHHRRCRIGSGLRTFEKSSHYQCNITFRSERRTRFTFFSGRPNDSSCHHQSHNGHNDDSWPSQVQPRAGVVALVQTDVFL